MSSSRPDEPWVAPGYERVRDLFVAGRRYLGRGGGAYSATVGGEPVADLWGGLARPGVPWNRDTVTVIASASKGLAGLCIQLLWERGQIDLDAPVSTYWPEFAQAGKEQTLVRQVLLHTAGVLSFPGQGELLRYDGSGWDRTEEIAAGLAAAAPEWVPGTRHGYHAVTYGWLVGELVRRISGRSVGRFFADEVAGPLGLRAWIRTPADRVGAVAHVYSIATAHLPALVRTPFEAALRTSRDPSRLSGRAFLGDGTTNLVEQFEALAELPAFLTAEFASGGGTADAWSLARLWALMGRGGELEGVRLLRADTVRTFAEVVSREPDALAADVTLPRLLAAGASAPVPRTLAYLGNGRTPGVGWRFGPEPTAYGAEGLGGQYGFCDPVRGISVGYVRNDLAVVDILQPALTRELYRCAAELGHITPVASGADRRSRVADAATGWWLRRVSARCPQPS